MSSFKIFFVVGTLIACLSLQEDTLFAMKRETNIVHQVDPTELVHCLEKYANQWQNSKDSRVCANLFILLAELVSQGRGDALARKAIYLAMQDQTQYLGNNDPAVPEALLYLLTALVDQGKLIKSSTEIVEDFRDSKDPKIRTNYKNTCVHESLLILVGTLFESGVTF